MKILRREPIPRKWWTNAECKQEDGHKPIDWDIPDGGPDSTTECAQERCNTECRVREYCLREALHTRELSVVRGGILFNGKSKVRCYFCGLACADPKTEVCDSCRDYDPCMGMCGRMVPLYGDSLYCKYCKPLFESVKTNESDDECQLLTPSDERSTKSLAVKSSSSGAIAA